jgi:lipoprotein-releasing system permease protein
MIGIERFVAYRMTLFDKNSFTGYILKFAIAAIALAVAVMIISTSVISGFKNEISYKMFDFWGHIVINDARASQEYELIPMENADEIMQDMLSIERVENFLQPALNEDGYIKASCDSGVEKVYPFSVMPALITTKEEEFDGLLLKGIEKEFNQDILSEYTIEGSVINLDSEDAGRELFISDQTAKRMKLEVEEYFILHFINGETTEKKRFKVAGIYKSGLEEFDRRFAFIDHRWISELKGWSEGEYSHIEVHIENLDHLELIDEYIKIERLPSYLISESIKSRSSEIFQWLEYQNINEWLTLTLMTLVGVFNMITAFLIFTLERTRMIGLLKSLKVDWDSEIE